MSLSPPLVIESEKIVCNTCYDHYDNQKCRNCRGRVGILKGVKYISDCLHFPLSSPHTCIAIPTPTHQHAPYLPLQL